MRGLPHAKFRNGQTMSMLGVLSMILSLAVLFVSPSPTLSTLLVAAALADIYLRLHVAGSNFPGHRVERSGVRRRRIRGPSAFQSRNC